MNVVGGTMACLVCAWSAARAGRPVRLFIPRRGLGNGFGGLQKGAYHLELGTRLIEVTAGPLDLPLQSYSADGPIRPFVKDVQAFITELLGEAIRPLGPAYTAFRGHCVSDFVSSLDFRSLPALLSRAELQTIRRELAARVDRPGPLVFTRDHRPNLAGIQLEQALLSNHGPAFQRLVIEPYADQVWPSWASALATHRQKLWTPIFFPETILSGLQGTPSRFRSGVSYAYPSDGGMKALLDALTLQLRANVEIVEYDDPRDLKVVPDVCGLSISELLRLTEKPPLHTFEMSVSWFSVPQAALRLQAAFIALHDPSAPGFRISFGGCAPPGQAIVALEGQRAPSTEHVGLYLKKLGVLDPDAAPKAIHHARLFLPAPTHDNVVALERARQSLWPTHWVGPARGLRADTLNEQIVQGLQLGGDQECLAHRTTSTSVFNGEPGRRENSRRTLDSPPPADTATDSARH